MPPPTNAPAALTALPPAIRADMQRDLVQAAITTVQRLAAAFNAAQEGREPCNGNALETRAPASGPAGAHRSAP